MRALGMLFVELFVFFMVIMWIAMAVKAQRLDGPDIGVDCAYGRGVLRMCRASCEAERAADQYRRVPNDRRGDAYRRCLDGCWGIKMAMEDCKGKPHAPQTQNRF